MKNGNIFFYNTLLKLDTFLKSLGNTASPSSSLSDTVGNQFGFVLACNSCRSRSCDGLWVVAGWAKRARVGRRERERVNDTAMERERARESEGSERGGEQAPGEGNYLLGESCLSAGRVRARGTYTAGMV